MPTSKNHSPAVRAHSVPTHPNLRRHRSDVVRWALANGHLVERDALAVIVAVRSDANVGRVGRVWTSDDVGRVLWSAAPIWCSSFGLRTPADLGTTLATYLRYLSGHRLLETGSDPMAVLRRAIADHQPSSRSSRARHPAFGSGTTAPVLPIS